MSDISILKVTHDETCPELAHSAFLCPFVKKNFLEKENKIEDLLKAVASLSDELCQLNARRAKREHKLNQQELSA